MTYLLLLVGFVLLIKGADFFVEGSSAVARKFHIPSMIIGMTIVAMGTSLPECAVSVTASVAGSNALAVSNVVGSNIFNLMVVCGACALWTPMAVSQKTLKQELPFSIAMGVILLILGYSGMEISRADGLIFLVIFVCFLMWMVRAAKANPVQPAEEEAKLLPAWKCVLYILLGGAAIMWGGDLVVNSASSIAAAFGLSQNLIGLTIVAIGTSLPELVTSVVASRKGEVDMALGNVLGSNVFNILMVLGAAAAISPIAFVQENMIDIILLTVMSLIVWIFAWTGKQVRRGEGIVMLLVYAAYMIYICIR